MFVSSPPAQLLSQQWAIVIGFFMPLLIAIIIQTPWSKEFKTATSFLACVAAAAIQLGIEGRLDARNFFPTTILVLTVSISTFQHFWKPLKIADAIERATNWGRRSESESEGES